MHAVKARLLTREDAVVGQPILYQHGAGYVPGTVINVRTKERVKREGDRPSGPIIATGEELHFGIRSETGQETGSAFYPDFLGPDQRGGDIGTRIIVPDEDGDLTVPVLDYIGCVTVGLGTTLFVPNITDPVEAKRVVLTGLDEVGLVVVGELNLRPATEQRVILRKLRDEAPVAFCYEHESHNLGLGAHYIEYLPVGLVTETATV